MYTKIITVQQQGKRIYSYGHYKKFTLIGSEKGLGWELNF